MSSRARVACFLVALSFLGGLGCSRPPLVRHGCSNCHARLADGVGPRWSLAAAHYCGPRGSFKLAAFLRGKTPGTLRSAGGTMPAIVARTRAISDREMDALVAAVKTAACAQ